MNDESIRLQARFEAIAADGAGDQREYQAVLVAAGRIRNADGSPGRYEVTADSIRNAVGGGMFEARAAFVDHAGALASPSLRDLFGVWHSTYYDEMRQAAVGTLRVFKTDATKPVVQLLDEIMATPERMRPDVGVSIVFYPVTEPGANQYITRVTSFKSVESADVVFLPAVEASRILAALAAEPGEDGIQLAAEPGEGAIDIERDIAPPAEVIFVPEAEDVSEQPAPAVPAETAVPVNPDSPPVEASANVTITVEIGEKEEEEESDGIASPETDMPDDDTDDMEDDMDDDNVQDDVVMQPLPALVVVSEAQDPPAAPPVEATAEVQETLPDLASTDAAPVEPEKPVEVAADSSALANETPPASTSETAPASTTETAEEPKQLEGEIPTPVEETIPAAPEPSPEPAAPEPVPAVPSKPQPEPPAAETRALPAAGTVAGASGGKIDTETVKPLPALDSIDGPTGPVTGTTSEASEAIAPDNRKPQASMPGASASIEIQTDHEEITDMSEEIVKQAAPIESSPQATIPQTTPAAAPTAQAAPAVPAVPNAVAPAPAYPPAAQGNQLPANSEWLNALQQASAKAIIYSSGLPTIIQQRLARFTYNSPAEVEAAIDEAKAELATLHEGAIVQVGGQPPRGSLMVTDALDEAKENINWLLGVSKAKTPPANMRRFDQLYVALTGDVEFRGMFDATRVMFAGATTTTLPNIAADALNKVIMEQMVRMDHWRWFERVVSVEPNDGSLNDMKWITMGGLSNLPTVEEGSAYLSLSVDDAKETAAFVKRGGYVGITREMIRGSNIMQLQAIPRGLANAAIRTRSAAISSIFTANNGVGPTLLQDNKALFHLDHNNLATGALDTTSWRAARAEAFKHQELNSGASLGIYPRFLLVPAELYDTALSLLGYGEGMPTVYTPEAVDRGFADPRPIPLVVPDWADQNNWAYVVDPAVYPVIQMSYAQAQGGGFHPAPEVFAVVSETSGLMFTNDTLPIKVRDEFAVGVNGPRGIGKRNVAG